MDVHGRLRKCGETRSQAYDEGSIPFTRSKLIPLTLPPSRPISPRNRAGARALLLSALTGEVPMTNKPADPKAKVAPAHPGMLGDGTEEQNLNQKGDPSARISEDEVKDAFGEKAPAPKP